LFFNGWSVLGSPVSVYCPPGALASSKLSEKSVSSGFAKLGEIEKFIKSESASRNGISFFHMIVSSNKSKGEKGERES